MKAYRDEEICERELCQLFIFYHHEEHLGKTTWEGMDLFCLIVSEGLACQRRGCKMGSFSSYNASERWDCSRRQATGHLHSGCKRPCSSMIRYKGYQLLMRREIFFSFGGIAALQVVHALATNWTHLDTKLDLGGIVFLWCFGALTRESKCSFPLFPEKSLITLADKICHC